MVWLGRKLHIKLRGRRIRPHPLWLAAQFQKKLLFSTLVFVNEFYRTNENEFLGELLNLITLESYHLSLYCLKQPFCGSLGAS